MYNTLPIVDFKPKKCSPVEHFCDRSKSTYHSYRKSRRKSNHPEPDNYPNLCTKFTILNKPRSQFRPCYSLCCENPFCRAKWAMREHAILAESFKIKPPTYFIVITFKVLPSYQSQAKCMRKLYGRLQYQDKKHYHDKTEHYSQIELSENSTFHIHLLLISQLSLDQIRTCIKKSIPAQTTVYVQPCRDPAATARYITKDMVGYAGPQWPRSFKGRGRRLTSTSKGFLAAGKGKLWAKAKLRWSQNKEGVTDLNWVRSL